MLSSTKKKYLFIIYELGYNGDTIRSVDIAKALGVKKASVSNIMPALMAENMVSKDENGAIVFTPEGAKFAGDLYLKYLTLYQFFRENLGSTENNARKDAVTCLCSLSNENSEHMIDYILKKTVCAAV